MRYFLSVILTGLVWLAAQPALACSPGVGIPELIQDDSPDCIIITTAVDDGWIIENQCGQTFQYLTHGWDDDESDGIQSNELASGEQGKLNSWAPENTLEWTLDDGRQGAFIIRRNPPPSPDCDVLGCDTNATQSSSHVAVLGLFLVFMAGARRWGFI